MPPTKPHLHLHRDEPPVQGDSIPFPGMNQRGWTPRLAGEGSFPDAPVDAIAMAEAALANTERSFLQLRAMVDDFDVQDRPRAA